MRAIVASGGDSMIEPVWRYSTCRYCGKPIQTADAYWFHTHTRTESCSGAPNLMASQFALPVKS